MGDVLGSAQGISHATDHGICAYLRYRQPVRWTSDKIKRRRDELGDTQEEFAARVGVSLRTVTAWEAGESAPRRTTELDKLGPPKEIARSRGRPVDLSTFSNAQLMAHLLEAAAELSRRLPDEHNPDFAVFDDSDELDVPFGIVADTVADKRLEG